MPSFPQPDGTVAWVRTPAARVSRITLPRMALGWYRSNGARYTNLTTMDETYAFYTQYTLGNFNFCGEYRRQPRDNIMNTATGGYTTNNRNSRQGYVSAAYRLSKQLEVGAYHSRVIMNWQAYHGDPLNHIFDTTVTGRIDLKNYLDLKVEGHFIDGNMVNSGLSRGFFVASSPNGFAPQTKMLVVRLGYHL